MCERFRAWLYQVMYIVRYLPHGYTVFSAIHNHFCIWPFRVWFQQGFYAMQGFQAICYWLTCKQVSDYVKDYCSCPVELIIRKCFDLQKRTVIVVATYVCVCIQCAYNYIMLILIMDILLNMRSVYYVRITYYYYQWYVTFINSHA